LTYLADSVLFTATMVQV